MIEKEKNIPVRAIYLYLANSGLKLNLHRCAKKNPKNLKKKCASLRLEGQGETSLVSVGLHQDISGYSG